MNGSRSGKLQVLLAALILVVPGVCAAQINLESSLGSDGSINPGHKDFGSLSSGFREQLFSCMQRDAVPPSRPEGKLETAGGPWEKAAWEGAEVRNSAEINRLVLRFNKEQNLEINRGSAQKFDITVEFAREGVFFLHNNNIKRKTGRMPGVFVKNDTPGWYLDYYEGGDEEGVTIGVYNPGGGGATGLVGICPRGRYATGGRDRAKQLFLVDNGYRLSRVLSAANASTGIKLPAQLGQVNALLSIITGPETPRSEPWRKEASGQGLVSELVYNPLMTEQLPIDNFRKRSLGLGVEVSGTLDAQGGISNHFNLRNTLYVDEVQQTREQSWLIKDFRGKENIVSPGACYMLFRETAGKTEYRRPPPTPTPAPTVAPGQ